MSDEIEEAGKVQEAAEAKPEAYDEWYRSIVNRFSIQQDEVSEKDYEKFKFDMFLRLAKRVSMYPDCGECQQFKGEIGTYSQNIQNVVQAADPAVNEYYKTLAKISRHLRKRHKLIRPGENLLFWSIIGIALGIISFVLWQQWVMLAGDVVLGVAIGSLLDITAKRKGKVL